MASQDELLRPVSGLTDPLRRLGQFHGRLRVVLEQLRALTSDVTGQGAAVVAVEVASFLNGPVRGHDNDEEAALLPRLRAAAERRGGHVVEVEKCVRDHRDVHRRIDALLPHLWALGKGDLVDMDELHNDAKALQSYFAEHLRMEETVLFPLARRILAPSELAAVGHDLEERERARERSALSACSRRPGGAP